eukprot:5650851-Ditylum_brightwellii.AAC.1
MIPEVTLMHPQSLGLPAPAARCSVKLNQDMKHHIKTSAGASHELYSHLSHRPKYGEGQGTTSLPSNWLFTSCSLLAALHSLCSQIYLSSVCRKFTSQQVAEVYVDNTNAAVIDQRSQPEETPSSLQDKMKNVAQTWETLLFGP